MSIADRAHDIVYRITGQKLTGDELSVYVQKNFDDLIDRIMAGSRNATIRREAPRRTPGTPRPEPTVMLATEYSGEDVTGWLLSEKFDGVRALWDGQNLISRNGNVFNAPAWFKAQLPAHTKLDGELFMGRGMFQKVPGILRRKTPNDAEWALLTYQIFDAPGDATAPLPDRLKTARRAIAGSAVCKMVEHFPCKGQDHLADTLKRITNAGGEGVVAKAPHGFYFTGRSESVVKIKPIYSDEAVVVDYVMSNPGWVKSIVCQWRGVQFKLGQGLGAADRLVPPKIGSAITFEYENTTDYGKPRFARFVAARDYE